MCSAVGALSLAKPRENVADSLHDTRIDVLGLRHDVEEHAPLCVPYDRRVLVGNQLTHAVNECLCHDLRCEDVGLQALNNLGDVDHVVLRAPGVVVGRCGSVGQPDDTHPSR